MDNITRSLNFFQNFTIVMKQIRNLLRCVIYNYNWKNMSLLLPKPQNGFRRTILYRLNRPLGLSDSELRLRSSGVKRQSFKEGPDTNHQRSIYTRRGKHPSTRTCGTGMRTVLPFSRTGERGGTTVDSVRTPFSSTTGMDPHLEERTDKGQPTLRKLKVLRSRRRV